MNERALAVVDAVPSGVPATMDNAPAVVLAEAQKAAAALHDVIKRKPRPVQIGGETYLELEDWALLARFYGYSVAAEAEPEYIEFGQAHGFKATAVAIDKNGTVRSRATAYCLNDEDRWSKAPTFQIASMAQTRAAAKALRLLLSWVAVLAGYKPTPAEEMDGIAHTPPHKAPISNGGARGPLCPKCGPAGKVIASKFAAKDGTHPWVCMECKTKWGNADAPKSAPAGSQGPEPDEPWDAEDEAR